ncbi:MAG: Hint domain-containing protein [Candidatus Pacearchaeota archaeon]|nr:Hint domain-containing protein [Candidatus Pacearchaeota archaeon]
MLKEKEFIGRGNCYSHDAVKCKFLGVNILLLTLSFLLIIFSLSIISAATSSYVRAAPAYTFSYQTSAYTGTQSFPLYDRTMCQAGQDFILQIDPAGCTPAVVRSDLLEEQEVAVFCPILATQLNPLIEVKDIDYLTITSNNLPKEVLTVGYQPAAAALGDWNPEITTSFLGNIGYATIVLKRQPNESAMPDFVSGNLTARLMYDVDNAFGTGRAVYYLPQLTDVEWNRDYSAYSFWEGRGYLRLEGADNQGASIGIYSDFDSSGAGRGGEKDKITTVNVEKGKTSGEVFLPGFNYCRGGLKIKLDGLENPDTTVRLRIDSETIELKDEEEFLEERCQVKEIIKQGINQRVEISCREDERGTSFTGSSFELRINPKVNISINGTTEQHAIGDKLYEQGTDSVYLGFVGNNGTTNSPRDLYIRLISIPLDRGGNAEKLTESEIAHMADYDGRVSPAEVRGRTSAAGAARELITKAIASGGSILRTIITGKDPERLHYIDGEKNIFGTAVRVFGYAGVYDTDLSGMPQNLRNNYTKAMDDYETIKASFSGEAYGEDLRTIGEQALFNAIVLANRVGQKSQALQLCQEFSEDYSDSAAPSICSNEYLLSNLEISGQSVLINGKTHILSFEGIKKPTYEEFGLEVNVGGYSDGHKETFELSKDEIVYINDSSGEYIQLVSLDENSATLNTNLIKTSVIGRIGAAVANPNQKLEEGKEELFGSRYSFSISKINLQRVARVSVEPHVDYARANASINFKIGIEKRGIQLSPEKAKEKIESLNKTIKTLTKISDSLGKVVTVGKTACLVTGGYLTFKNFFANLEGSGLARQRVMRTDDVGWYDKCRNAVTNNAQINGKGPFSNIEQCLQANSAAIDASVNAVDAVIKQQNQETKDREEGISHTSFLGETTVDTDASLTRLIEGNYINDITAKTNEVFTTSSASVNNKIKVGNNEVAVSEIISHINSNTITLTQAENLQLNARLLNSPDATAAAIARNQVEKALGEIYSNSQAEVQRETLSAQYGLPFSISSTERLTDLPLTQINTFAEVKNRFSGASIADNTYVTGFQNQLDGRKYLLTLSNDFVITQTYLIGALVDNKNVLSVADPDPEKVNPLRLNPKKIDATTYQNRYTNAEVRYYETEPYRGLPAVVPFDTTNGWYAAVKSELPILGGLRAYDSSGRVSSFYVCNVGPNGREDNMGADDNCQGFVPGTGQAPVFSGMNAREAEQLMTKAVSAISYASSHHTAGLSHITINGQSINVGEPAANIPNIQCEDFMSPSDCNLLFNVCDPFICPSSRCDLGGTYPVKDVVQSGLAGSIFLCMPNFPEVKVPVCVTGVHAGVDAYNSVLKSYRECLQTSIDTGQTLGVCDELNSIYTCEFLWKEIIPIAKYAIPKIAGGVISGSSGGGGEYLGISDAMSNAEKSVDYFTQYYADDSFKAFKARSTQEVGGEFCKKFTSFVGPEGGNMLDALVAPDSPSQFYGRFEEISYTTATNPPVSQYKVFYHIYAGNDYPAYYQVYLRGTGSSFYQDTNLERPVASGFIPAGEFKTETKDFTAPSGYKQLCIVVNGQEECGFQQVTTEFGFDYLSEQYAAQQASQKDVNSEAECVSGSPSTYSFLNPVSAGQIASGIIPQSAAEEALNPAIYNRGIIRVCATSNPGQGTDVFVGTNKSRWQPVGNCGSENLKCWLDTDSVKNVIKNANILNQTLGEVGNNYVQRLQEEGQFITEDAFTDEVFYLNSLNSSTQKIIRINANISKTFYNNQRAYLHLLRGNAYGNLATELYSTEIARQKTAAATATTRPEIIPGLPVAEQIDLGINYPVFEFQDGTARNNRYYTFDSEKWNWCVNNCDEQKNWYEAAFAEFAGTSSGEDATSITLIPSLGNTDKQFILHLADKDYLQGLQLLIHRTTQNAEGGILPCWLGGCTLLSTDKVDFSYDGTFTVTGSESYQIPGATYTFKTKFEFVAAQNKWRWSPSTVDDWVFAPETEVKEGSFRGQQAKAEIANLINSLNGKTEGEGALIIFSISTASPLGAGLSEVDAREIVDNANIEILESVKLQGVHEATLSEIVNLKTECSRVVEDCVVVITSATDGSHAEGTYSHANGYKVDLRITNSNLNNYIENHFDYIGLRSSDNARQYRHTINSNLYAIYAREAASSSNTGAHWDVVVRPKTTATSASDTTTSPAAVTGSFIAGTQITTPLGLKLIEELNIGDEVYSLNPLTNGFLKKNIIDKYEIPAKNTLNITFSDKTNLIVTQEHPFWNPTTKSYKKIKDFKVGDKVLSFKNTNSAKELIITSIEPIPSYEGKPVYNLRVDGEFNNYLANGILVHNKYATTTDDALLEGDAIAEDLMSTQDEVYTDLTTREKIDTIESEFGTGSVKRWDSILYPRQITCPEYNYNNLVYPSTTTNIALADVERIKSAINSGVINANKNSYHIILSPSYAYAIAAGEGLFPGMLEKYCNRKRLGISPYTSYFRTSKYFGLDNPQEDDATLKSSGFLRSDFCGGYSNSQCFWTPESISASAYSSFSNFELGTEFFAARLAWTKWQFITDVENRGVNIASLSEDQINFWTYIYYNSGVGNGRTYLNSHVRNGVLNDEDYIHMPGQTVVHGRSARDNAVMFTATAKFIREQGIFEE